MSEFIVEFSSEIKTILGFITLPFLVFLVGLAHVYFWGRMLGVLKNPYIKNLLATATMVGCYLYYFMYIEVTINLEARFWSMITYTSISILLYTLIGFTLYDRVEAFFDRLSKPKNKRGKKE